jgi:hypothetical protein
MGVELVVDALDMANYVDSRRLRRGRTARRVRLVSVGLQLKRPQNFAFYGRRAQKSIVHRAVFRRRRFLLAASSRAAPRRPRHRHFQFAEQTTDDRRRIATGGTRRGNGTGISSRHFRAAGKALAQREVRLNAETGRPSGGLFAWQGFCDWFVSHSD